MSRSFERVLEKLAEARFFYGRFPSSTDPQKANYYFSAFASAARSVTFTLQAVCADVEGFDSWYAAERATLATDPVARFLLEVRNETQKVGLIPLHSAGVGTSLTRTGKFHCTVLYHLVELDGGTPPPDVNAAEACRAYFEALAGVVLRCHAQFGPVVDPSHAFGQRIRRLTKPAAITAPQCPLDRVMHRALGPRYREVLLDAANTLNARGSRSKHSRNAG